MITNELQKEIDYYNLILNNCRYIIKKLYIGRIINYLVKRKNI